MRNVIAYTRVSTEGQALDDSYGLDAQREDIIEYCENNDLNIVKWYRDVKSGAEWRQGFDEIVFGDTSNPPIEAVVVGCTDRVAREVDIYFCYKGLLKRKNIELISVTEDFGREGRYAPMYEMFTTLQAKMERDNITRRTSGGRKIKAARGGYSGGRAPMGYKIENGSLVINEDEAPVVRFIFERKRRGETMMSTVDALNEAGYKTRNGGKFVISTVQSIWHNEKTYQGWYKYGKDGEWVKGQHEPILKED